jgi:hypothetical protein
MKAFFLLNMIMYGYIGNSSSTDKGFLKLFEVVRLRVMVYPMRITKSLPGPCMPLKGVACMSAVELGPVMRISWLGMVSMLPTAVSYVG